MIGSELYVKTSFFINASNAVLEFIKSYGFTVLIQKIDLQNGGEPRAFTVFLFETITTFIEPLKLNYINRETFIIINRKLSLTVLASW